MFSIGHNLPFNPLSAELSQKSFGQHIPIPDEMIRKMHIPSIHHNQDLAFINI